MSGHNGATSLVRSDALVACPFCGSPAKLDEPVDAIVGERVVVCTGCRIRTYPGPEYRVVMAWNRRQANAEAVPRRDSDVNSTALLADSGGDK